MLPASRQPIPLRKRPDLEVTPQQFGATRYWLIKDPVTLHFYHLREEEYALLSLLDGTSNLLGIQRQFQQRFPPQQISLEAIKAFVADLHRNNLVISDAPEQGRRLARRAEKNRRRSFAAALTNVLAIRIRGIDPRPILRFLGPVFGRLFSPSGYLCAAILALSAFVLAMTHFDVLASRLPRLEAVLAGPNLVWLIVCIGAVKVAHEFGHALACQRYGGQCHDVGLMFLAFIPCLYTDVTDAWRFPNKWHRIAVSAAGMYVEVLIASACAFLWWFSEPGLFNALCLNLIIVCSVSTVVFNGNPLLRLDGYYILADLAETPNLWQRSRLVVRQALGRWCLGLEETSIRRTGSRRGLLAGYGVASMCYRVVVVALILWFVYRLLAAHDLQSVGRLLVIFVVVAMVVPSAVSAGSNVRNPLWRRSIKPRRLLLTILIAGGLGLAILSVPLPYRVAGDAVVRAADARPVFVDVPGHVKTALPVGTRVKAGAQIALLADPHLTREIRRLEAARTQQSQRVKTLESRRLFDDSAAALLPAARAALKDVTARLEQLRRQERELSIVAPVEGVVLPSHEQDTHAGDAFVRRWPGTPLDPQNRGMFLDYGRLLCVVGQPNRFEALAVVSEQDVDAVAVGQSVDLEIDALPGRPLEGKVVGISPGELQDDPESFLPGGKLPGERRRADAETERVYTVRIQVLNPPAALIHRGRATARIRVPPRSLGARLVRFLRQTFQRAN